MLHKILKPINFFLVNAIYNILSYKTRTTREGDGATG